MSVNRKTNVYFTYVTIVNVINRYKYSLHSLPNACTHVGNEMQYRFNATATGGISIPCPMAQLLQAGDRVYTDDEQFCGLLARICVA